MRILIDLQCCQSDSRYGGIGRYSMSLAKAMLRGPSPHRFGLLLNASLPNENFIRSEFSGLLAQQDIHTFVLPPFIAADNDLPAHTRIAELIREKRIAEIAPDILHVASLFEGAGENVVTSVGLLFPAGRTAVTLYDLIPFLEQETYLGRAVLADHYLRKFGQLQSAGALVSISEFSRQEALEHTRIPASRIVNISSAADGQFAPRQVGEPARTELLRKCGIDKPFVMFTGSFDARKNHVRLVKAFAKVLPALAEPCQLVIVGKGLPRQVARLKAIARYHGLADGDLVFVGHVTDAELVALYNLTVLFVFPSLREGFGLPVLEAMSCGVATIGSNRTSVPEVIARPDALFDPLSVDDMAAKLHRALSDDAFRDDLRRHGLERAKEFSWGLCASRAIDAFERLDALARDAAPAPDASGENLSVYAQFRASLTRLELGPVDPEFLEAAARTIAINESMALAPSVATNLRIRWGWVTPWSSSSDVARYSQRVLSAFPAQPVLFALGAKDEEPIDRTPAYWQASRGAVDIPALQGALAATPIDVVVIQVERESLSLEALAALVVGQKKLGREVFVTFHSTQAVACVSAGAAVDIRAALKSCAGIFVHSMADVNGLDGFNVRKNVYLLPEAAAAARPATSAVAGSAEVASAMFTRMVIALGAGRGQSAA